MAVGYLCAEGGGMKVFLVDVDGVLTTGQFFYSAEGKVMKVFGPDDHDGLSLLKSYLHIHFITGDRKGFEITKKRVVDDMKFPLDLVSTTKRYEWILDKWQPQEVIYMGDGIFDHYVFKKIGYSICPANGFYLAKERANFVTKQPGGDRAVAEACLHIMEKFFKPYLPDENLKSMQGSGDWTV